ncbi:hypothetical protein TRVL_07193 [Trypanosoma vivax]|nr:hypothetical protein TRVL_07193 [Trypanosoma vivax]
MRLPQGSRVQCGEVPPLGPRGARHAASTAGAHRRQKSTAPHHCPPRSPSAPCFASVQKQPLFHFSVVQFSTATCGGPLAPRRGCDSTPLCIFQWEDAPSKVWSHKAKLFRVSKLFPQDCWALPRYRLQCVCFPVELFLGVSLWLMCVRVAFGRCRACEAAALAMFFHCFVARKEA